MIEICLDTAANADLCVAGYHGARVTILCEYKPSFIDLGFRTLPCTIIIDFLDILIVFDGVAAV